MSFCTCSDPDYCMKWYSPEQRAEAIDYRRRHGAALPRSETPSLAFYEAAH